VAQHWPAANTRIAQSKKKRSDELSPERFRNWLGPSLANLRPHRTAVALEANLAAGKQVSYRGNRFSRAFGARTDGHNQISEGKFGTGLENLCLFHVWMSED
jgi:hypothetical protein